MLARDKLNLAMPGTSFNITAMAETEVVNQSDPSRRTWKGKMVPGMWLNLGSTMVAVRSPGGCRSIAGVELLRQLMAVKVGGNKPEKEEEREGVREMRFLTKNALVTSGGLGEVEQRRNLKNFVTGVGEETANLETIKSTPA
jgi:hypothetical protein